MAAKTRLLVRADDAGSSWESNIGCLRACTEGIARSVEVMMPGAWVPHAAALFNPHPTIDIGIHLTLTSEWDAVRWRPLTMAPTLIDDTGHFLPFVLPRDGDPRPCLADRNWSLDEVIAELKAQMALGTALFRQASHVSTHMLRHLSDLDPILGEAVAELCHAFGLADDAFGHGLPRIAGYPPFPRAAGGRTEAFIDELCSLPAGTFIFIDHPAVWTDALAATGHAGYRDVAADRGSCLETLVSPDLARCIAELEIELISYRDL